MVASLAVALVIAGAGRSAAHDGHSHGSKLMGTVKAVSAEASRVELTTKDGKTTAFYVSPETKFLKGTATLSLADLKPGTRVVVDTKVQGEKTVATMVRLAGPPTAPKGISPPQ